jgi:hypothetical protein
MAVPVVPCPSCGERVEQRMPLRGIRVAENEIKGRIVDRLQFVDGEPGSWWLVETDPGYAVAEARRALGARFGWHDEYWYTERAKREELFNSLEANDPRLLSEVDICTYEDQRVQWLQLAMASHRSSASLSKSERGALERVTESRLDRSYTTLVHAIAGVKVDELKKSLRKSPDLVTTIFQIAIGLAFPPIGKAISELADDLPAEASNVAYRIALAAADEKKSEEAVRKIYEFGKSKFESAEARQEISKEEADQKFLDKITNTYNQGIDQLEKRLSSLTDDELGLVYIAYDPAKLTAEHYTSQVERLLSEYRSEVEEIGVVEQESVLSGIRQVRTLRYIITDEMNNERFLAAVDSGRGGVYFIEQIHAEVEQDAIDQWKASEDGKYNHGVIPSVRHEIVQGIPPSLLVSRPADPVAVPPQLRVSPFMRSSQR